MWRVVISYLLSHAKRSEAKRRSTTVGRLASVDPYSTHGIENNILSSICHFADYRDDTLTLAWGTLDLKAFEVPWVVLRCFGKVG